jgi:hypothetical protein
VFALFGGVPQNFTVTETSFFVGLSITVMERRS